jgi:hypothetical protein
MTRRSPEYCAAVRDGVLRCARARAAREDAERIVVALREAGHADLFAPLLRDAAIMRELEAMRVSAIPDPALRRALERKPRSVVAYIRRRSDVLDEALRQGAQHV